MLLTDDHDMHGSAIMPIGSDDIIAHFWICTLAIF
jgi:hypothetical protein